MFLEWPLKYLDNVFRCSDARQLVQTAYMYKVSGVANLKNLYLFVCYQNTF